ncbi:MAG: hypothetical protein QOG28_5534 [Trebonia sp.]|jgi:hypothetical protein|nr:hypothetical protein [Actinomycetes bacterium]MDX6420914.1 hypothetical protein [Trebonia sp.]
MSNDLAMTMDELERESAELLPSRETLWCCKGHSGYGVSNSFNFTQVAAGGNSYGGLVNIPILSGNAINIAL